MRRVQIEAAMDRLLAGTPLRSAGKLTIVSLAIEADVMRHVLTHKHTDLKDRFLPKDRQGLAGAGQALIKAARQDSGAESGVHCRILASLPSTRRGTSA